MCIQIIIFHSPRTLTEQGFISGCQQKLEAGVMGWHIHHWDVRICHCSVAIHVNYKKTTTMRILKKTQVQLTHGSSGHTLCHCKNCQGSHIWSREQQTQLVKTYFALPKKRWLMLVEVIKQWWGWNEVSERSSAMDSQQLYLLQKTAFLPVHREFLLFDTDVSRPSVKMRNWSPNIWLPRICTER